MTSYVKTTFVDDAAPGVSAAELNKIGTGIETAHSEIAALITGAEVATTIAGLDATPAAGQLGMLRLGATPFDFIALTYDATLGKWVSPEERFVCSSAVSYSGGSALTLDLPSAVNSFAASACLPHLPWAPRDTAGLRPQFRWTLRSYDNAANTASAVAGYLSNNLNAIFTAFVALGGTSTIIASGAYPTAEQMKQSDWLDLPGGYTVKDFILPTLRLTSSGGGSVVVRDAVCTTRWVSA